MILTGEIERDGTKFVSVLFCIPQIPHELALRETRVSAFGSWKLTAWTMSCPDVLFSADVNMWLGTFWIKKTGLRIICAPFQTHFAAFLAAGCSDLVSVATRVSLVITSCIPHEYCRWQS